MGIAADVAAQKAQYKMQSEEWRRVHDSQVALDESHTAHRVSHAGFEAKACEAAMVHEEQAYRLEMHHARAAAAPGFGYPGYGGPGFGYPGYGRFGPAAGPS